MGLPGGPPCTYSSDDIKAANDDDINEDIKDDIDAHS